MVLSFNCSERSEAGVGTGSPAFVLGVGSAVVASKSGEGVSLTTIELGVTVVVGLAITTGGT